jgi:hypothetical protein
MTLKDDLEKASQEAIEETDALLSDEYNSLKQASKSDLNALRPKVSNPALYDKIIPIIAEATQNNLSLAELQQRLERLGIGAVKLGKEVVKLLTI